MDLIGAAPTTREERLSRVFDILDTNSNGHLERADFVALAERIADWFSCAPNSPHREILHESFTECWDTLLEAVEATGNQRISREEFSHAMVGRLAGKGGVFEVGVRPAIAAGIALADRDKDGALNRAEFTELHRAIGVPHKHIDLAFDQIDIHGNGVLTFAELIEHSRRFCTAIDPDPTGGWPFDPAA